MISNGFGGACQMVSEVPVRWVQRYLSDAFIRDLSDGFLRY